MYKLCFNLHTFQFLRGFKIINNKNSTKLMNKRIFFRNQVARLFEKWSDVTAIVFFTSLFGEILNNHSIIFSCVLCDVQLYKKKWFMMTMFL